MSKTQTNSFRQKFKSVFTKPAQKNTQQQHQENGDAERHAPKSTALPQWDSDDMPSDNSIVNALFDNAIVWKKKYEF